MELQTILAWFGQVKVKSVGCWWSASHQLLLWRSPSTRLLCIWGSVTVRTLWSSCFSEAFMFGHGQSQHAELSPSVVWPRTVNLLVFIRAGVSWRNGGSPGAEEQKRQSVQMQVKEHNWKIFWSIRLCCWVLTIYLSLRCFHSFNFCT